MKGRRSVGRLVVVFLSGGCLLQFVGCSTGLLPLLLSFAESAVLSALFSQVVGP